MMEAMNRDYLVRAAGVRPENTGLTHTAYIVFATKKPGRRERKALKWLASIANPAVARHKRRRNALLLHSDDCTFRGMDMSKITIPSHMWKGAGPRPARRSGLRSARSA